MVNTSAAAPAPNLTLIRLQRAAQTLAATEDSLAIIAEAVGYQSEAVFSTAFKRHFGVRPREYRVTRTAEFLAEPMQN